MDRRILTEWLNELDLAVGRIDKTDFDALGRHVERFMDRRCAHDVTPEVDAVIDRRCGYTNMIKRSEFHRFH